MRRIAALRAGGFGSRAVLPTVPAKDGCSQCRFCYAKCRFCLPMRVAWQGAPAAAAGSNIESVPGLLRARF